MAASITKKRRESWGSQYAVPVTVELDDAYPEGGYPLSRRWLGLVAIDDVIVTDGGGFDVAYDPEAGTLVVRVVAAEGDPATEVADETDLSGVVVRAIVVGH